MTDTAAETTTVQDRPSRYHARRAYRHRVRDCGRLLFVGYLPPGTYIEIRCPTCGRIHVIQVTGDEGEPLD